MKKFFVFMAVMLFSTAIYAQTVNVTFQCNMAVQIAKGLFVKGADSVCIRGDFQTLAGDAGDWSGFKFKLLPKNDSIYTLTVNFPSQVPDKALQFKFVKGPDSWEGAPNRPFVVGAADQTLYPFFYNDDSTRVIKTAVSLTINFTADLRTMIGSGQGYFDPTTDSIQVMGLDWDGLGTMVGETPRTMVSNPLFPGLYKTTMTVKGFPADSTKWKFRAFPDTRYNNTGWETGADRWIKYPYSDSTVTLGNIIPSIAPSYGPLATDVNVIFRVNMAGSPKNAKNGLPIPVADIQWVAVKGGSVPIGNWGGIWTAADTTIAVGSLYPTLTRLNDSGVDGDAVPGDKLWSKKVVFPAATSAGLIEFKYACMYPLADTVAGGTTPMDNEGGFGANHTFTLIVPKSGNTITLYNDFGVMISDVRQIAADKSGLSFDLKQNYPNPFNPSTKISFAIPQDGFVNLRIYNIAGQEVGSLVNQQMKKGSYDVSYNASSLATGVYLYKLSVGDFSMTKKMMLIK